MVVVGATDSAGAAGCSVGADVVGAAGSVVDGVEQDLGCVSRFGWTPKSNANVNVGTT